jgi:hypothetical protein
MLRKGNSLQVVANRFGVSKSTVRNWNKRTEGKQINRIDWSDKRTARIGTHNRTKTNVEQCVLRLRTFLKEKSALGEYGGEAIRREMQSRNCPMMPAVRTINTILSRHGCFDSKRRTRRPAPPSGWYLPSVMDGEAELDSFDYVEDLRLEGKLGYVQVLNGISLLGGLACSFPMCNMSSENTVSAMVEHWKSFGVPTYVQFDNATVFEGPRHPNCVGKVIRVCLSLDVIPVFVPPRETGFQANVERYNGMWQRGVWDRFCFKSWQALLKQSKGYVEAYRDKRQALTDATPSRYEIPNGWQIKYDEPLRGTIIFIRRTNDKGVVNVLGNGWVVDKNWVHRLVRAEVKIDENVINFYRLRRRDPTDQLLLSVADYHLPNKKVKV